MKDKMANSLDNSVRQDNIRIKRIYNERHLLQLFEIVCSELGSDMNKRYSISANYTVEAAFIVPVILGIIFAMIYMLFFLHDKVILQENLRYSVISIDENEGTEKNTTGKNGISKREISKNLRMIKVTNVNCNVGKIYIKAEVKAVSKINIPVVRYFLKRKNKIYLKIKYLRLKPHIMVRYRNGD